MKKSVLTLLVVPVAFGGCATPLPVVDTPKYEKELPFKANTFDDVKISFMGFYHAYNDEAKDKRRKNQTASETSFYSSIIGLIGGVAEAVPVAIAGATVAAGSGIYSDRYRLQVQAGNYEMAADAMLCMYFASQDLTSDGLKKLTIADKPAEVEAREIARDALLKVRDKLYRLQASFVLGQPDISKLKDALKAAPANNVSKASGFATFDVKEEEALKEYKNKIDQCVARITG
ncbi:MAG: hypothetical protein Q8K62_03540 [Thiobacillus sp.]|nr:hypothetical protein [Thiobacillus sp.]